MAAKDADLHQAPNRVMGQDSQTGSKKDWSRLSETTTSIMNKTKSDMITYEDLLVHKYLENIKRERIDNQQARLIPSSPYCQRLSHSNCTPTRCRSASAARYGSRLSSGKPKIDSWFIADIALWNPATPRKGQSCRPRSVPNGHSRPLSVVSQKSKDAQSVYRMQSCVIKAFAYINGCKNKCIHLAAPNIKTFLELATEKLDLPFAARRLFKDDGEEIFLEKDFPLDGDIFVSMGEGFKDPYYDTKRNMVIRNGSTWNLKGVILPDNGHKKKVKTRLSKRIRALCEKKKVRILVFKNGQSSSPCEVVTDLKDTEDFFTCCTTKLKLRSRAKTAYNWEGKEMTNLAETSILDEHILQEGKSTILGPLWISTGEGFSPSGAHGFLLMMKNAFKNKMKIAKLHKQNINFALDNKPEKVTDVTVLSMSTEELYEAAEKYAVEIDKYNGSIAHIKSKIEALQEDILKEEEEGVKYRLSHIQEISTDDPLVGTRGCKLKVFENGKSQGAFTFYFNIREALKGVDSNNSKEMVMQRLLDELSNTKFSADVSRNLNSVATKLYDKNGCEITDILAFEKEQARQFENNVEQPEIPVWLSFGEPYICPFTYALHLFLDKVTIQEENEGQRIVREAIPAEFEHLTKDQNKWEVVTELTDRFSKTAHSDIHSHFLQHKDQHNFILYPEIIVAEKLTCRNQQFVYTESGYIYCKAAPQLYLTASDVKLETKLLNKDISVEGHIVCMQKKLHGNPGQVWRCTPYATLYSEAYPNLLLTYLGNKREFDSDTVDNGYSMVEQPSHAATTFLIVTDPLSKKDRGAQRFAFKQENFQNLGQWKKTEHSNPDWNKLAYSWPVRANGELNREYDWPMEGFLIPNAPSLKKSGNKHSLSGITPVRLKVLKNFDPNEDQAINVVGLNITNFLETCTGLLNLPSAARRLFNSSGKELITIQNLERDTLVYVSCGEEWAGTSVSRLEQKRRFLLSQLSSDVAKIQQYCSLRNPENFVLEVNGSLAPKSGLIVNKLWSHEVISKHDQGDVSLSTESFDKALSQNLDNQDDGDIYQDSGPLTAHQRAHLQSEERLNSLKWPWEKLVNVAHSMEIDDPDAIKYTDPDLYAKFKPQTSSRLSRDMLQKFHFENEYIAVAANENLVLSISGAEGHAVSVILAKRSPDDIHQRWIIRDNGEIQSRHNQNLVLTVNLPATISDEHTSLSFAGCSVTLQKRCSNAYGKAHQMWQYDAENGLIRAFDSDSFDKEITAANKADVCTFAIAQAADIDQPGYLVEIDGQQHNTCVSCARALGGKYKVKRLPPNTKFYCTMGDARKLNIPQIGSFKVLNNKVDLSTFEADLSLKYWTDMLHSLRQQTNVKTIMKEISAAKSVLTVKVLAYKNGEGRLRKGEIICGSSIEGILCQCTHRLEMSSAACRIYLEDGTVVLDMDDFVKFAVENCKTEMINTILFQKTKKKRLDVKEETTSNLLHSRRQINDNSISEELRKCPDILTIPEPDQESKNERRINLKSDKENELSPMQEKDFYIEKVTEALMSTQEREKLLENYKLPSMEIILQAPIEVWISSGKAFIPPEVVESKEENVRKKRQFRAQVCLALDIEKHLLRQMKGRRLEQMNPGMYRSTLSSQQPVVLENHWRKPTLEEQDMHYSIGRLQSHLGEIKAIQSEAKVPCAGINLNRKLYYQPNMKRVLVFPNGTSADKSVYVWGDTIQEMLDCAAFKLNIWKQPCILYNMEGKKIEKFEEIQRDQLLCVSSGKHFLPPSSQKANMEVKANLCRAHRLYGKHSTDVSVNVQKNSQVDVDPFGPPLLALPDNSYTQCQTVSHCATLNVQNMKHPNLKLDCKITGQCKYIF